MSYGGGTGAGCLTGVRFSMSAVLLHQNDNYVPDESEQDMNKYGEWVRSQDPLTKEIVREWRPYTENIDIPDNPDTPDIDESVTLGTIPCLVRGITDGGIRGAATSEVFGENYESIDYIRMWVPAHVRISKRDRITSIKDSNGHIRWLDEESVDPRNPNDIPKATVFNVGGVVPLFDAYNVAKEQFVLLSRAEVS